MTDQQTNQSVVAENPLLISIDDSELNRVLDERIKIAKERYREDDLTERRKKNRDYFLGNHEPNKHLKTYQAKYMDNVIYEAEASIKPIALSRLPDLLVKPANDTNESKETADGLTEVVNSEIRQRQNRRTLGVMHKHLPIYLIGACKYRWDPNKGNDGDYVFEFRHPDNLLLDYVPSTNPDDMTFIVDTVRMTIKEALIRFPNKKKELLEAVFGNVNDEQQEKARQRGYATQIEIQEVWFSWFNEENEEPQREEYVLWRYSGSRDVILHKMRNPNFDYEGRTIYVTQDENGEDVELGMEELMLMQLGMLPPMPVEKRIVYRNFFEQPRKPFIFINYDWLGESPMDSTSRIEQSILLQENIDIRGRQITDIANRSRGKNIFSAEAGIKKDDVQRLDFTNPAQDIHIQQDIDKAYRFVPGEQPSEALFREQDMNRQRLFAKMGVNDTTRGQIATDTATTAQIARESDFGRIDDLVEETINYAAEEMVRAALHMIKLRYTEEHMRKIIGRDGSVVFQSLTSDMIEDGMEVEVFASGTDRVMRERKAYERAGMNLTDPLTFFEDTDSSNPKERARRLMLYLSDPASYQMQVIEDMDPEEMALQLQSAQAGQDTGGQEALNAIAQLQQGGQPPLPQQVTPSYLDTLNNFLQSPEYGQLPPEITATIQQFAQQAMNTAQQNTI